MAGIVSVNRIEQISQPVTTIWQPCIYNNITLYIHHIFLE